jgi:hypothetical protein
VPTATAVRPARAADPWSLAAFYQLPNHPKTLPGCPAGWPRSAGRATAPTPSGWRGVSTTPT